MRIFAGVAASLFFALASDSAAADCPPTLSPDAPQIASELRQGAENLIRLAKATGPLEKQESLEGLKKAPPNVRQTLEIVRCAEPALSPAELASIRAFEERAAKWADEEERLIAAEEKGRASVVVPLCQTVWTIAALRRDLEQERANPSGVVDLRALHHTGELLQQQQAVMAEQKPAYAAFRRHPFVKWENEGACVAESKKPD